MKHDNSCLSRGRARVREAGRREEIACFIPRQTSGKVRRESGFNLGIFRICQSLAHRGTNGIRIEPFDFFFFDKMQSIFPVRARIRLIIMFMGDSISGDIALAFIDDY